MNVSCPQCKTVFRVDPRKVPAEGVRARCSVCGGVFEVVAEPKPPGSAPAAPAPRVAEPVAPPPPTELAEPKTPPRPERPQPAPPPGEPAAQRIDVEPPEEPPVAEAASPQPVDIEPEPRAEPSIPPPPSPPPVPPAPPAPSPPVAPSPPRDVRPPTREPEPAAPPEVYPAEPTPTPRAPEAPSPGRPAAMRPAQKFGEVDHDARARRLARALISDLAAYYPDRQEKGLKEGRLKELFQDELRKSWQEYVEQVGLELAKNTPYFRDALNEILARGKQVF